MPAVIVPDLTEVARQWPAGWFVHGQCRLVHINTQTVRLVPYQGNFLWIDGHPQVIPDAGVDLPVAGLVSNQNYLVAAYLAADDQIALRAVPLAVGHFTSPGLGIEVLANNPRETLVGMVRPIANAFWAYAVLSWHHRRARTSITSFTASRSTPILVPSWVEVDPEIRQTVLTWRDEVVRITIMATHHNPASNSGVLTGIVLDGVLRAVTGTGNTPGSPGDVLFSAVVTDVYTDLADGDHYATLGGAARGGGTATWEGPLTTGIPGVTLMVEVYG